MKMPFQAGSLYLDDFACKKNASDNIVNIFLEVSVTFSVHFLVGFPKPVIVLRKEIGSIYSLANLCSILSLSDDHSYALLC